VVPRASRDNMEHRKFLTVQGLKLLILGRPACSQSLYRLCYSGSQLKSYKGYRMSQGIVTSCSISQMHPHLQKQWAIAKAVGVEEYSHRFFQISSSSFRNRGSCLFSRKGYLETGLTSMKYIILILHSI
jgi:hypothetical protein